MLLLFFFFEGDAIDEEPLKLKIYICIEINIFPGNS